MRNLTLQEMQDLARNVQQNADNYQVSTLAEIVEELSNRLESEAAYNRTRFLE